MSTSATDLKISFEQAILKIPKYSLESSLYDALTHKMVDDPLKLCFKEAFLCLFSTFSGSYKEVTFDSIIIYIRIRAFMRID